MGHPIDNPEPTAGVTATGYTTDVRTLTERIAIRLAQAGAEHPVAAAVAIAVRGRRGLSQADFATQLGIGVDELIALESGAVGLADLPAVLREHVSVAGLCMSSADALERHLRATR